MAILEASGKKLKSGSGLILSNIVATVVSTPAVMIAFDDGAKTQYQNAFPYMSTKDVKGTCYIIPNNIDVGPGTMTSEQLAELYAAGWDLANHTWDHTNLTTLTQAQVESKLTQAQEWLDDLGYTRASRHVAYPFGAYNATVLAAMAAAGMLTGRTTVEALETLPASDNYEITAYSVDSGTTLAQAKALVDDAVSQNKILIAYFHNITSTPGADDWSISDFEDLIDYIEVQGVATITMSEFYEQVYA